MRSSSSSETTSRTGRVILFDRSGRLSNSAKSEAVVRIAAGRKSVTGANRARPPSALQLTRLLQGSASGYSCGEHQCSSPRMSGHRLQCGGPTEKGSLQGGGEREGAHRRQEGCWQGEAGGAAAAAAAAAAAPAAASAPTCAAFWPWTRRCTRRGWPRTPPPCAPHPAGTSRQAPQPGPPRLHWVPMPAGAGCRAPREPAGLARRPAGEACACACACAGACASPSWCARTHLLCALHAGGQLRAPEAEAPLWPPQRRPVQALEAPLLQAVADDGDVLRVVAGELVEAAQAEQQVLKAVPRVLLQAGGAGFGGGLVGTFCGGGAGGGGARVAVTVAGGRGVCGGRAPGLCPSAAQPAGVASVQAGPARPERPPRRAHLCERALAHAGGVEPARRVCHLPVAEPLAPGPRRPARLAAREQQQRGGVLRRRLHAQRDVVDEGLRLAGDLRRGRAGVRVFGVGGVGVGWAGGQAGRQEG
jgi:hypothetical protein